MADQPNDLFALLVGIDEYAPRTPTFASPGIPNLRGCVNDVNAMEQLLLDHYGVPPENIRKLTNEQATHEAIKKTFEEFLIGNAKRLEANGAQGATESGRSPAFLFHYSGHGSQARDETGTKPNGLDETIVPHDSRVGGVFDIKDWELGLLVGELESRSDNVTVFLDCCHSGSGTRAVDDDIEDDGYATTRRCPTDMRPQPATSQRPASIAPGTRSVGDPPNNTLSQSGEHVLLAGCRDREEANEYRVKTEDDEYSQGAMTFFLIQELQSSSRVLTYAELHERVSSRVNSLYRNQMPQCEGTRDRKVFGGAVPARDASLHSVIDQGNGLIWINAGIAQGMSRDTELLVYPPDTRYIADAGDPLATLVVRDVGAVKSACVFKDASPVVEIEPFCRVAVSKRGPGALRARVVLDIPDPATDPAPTPRPDDIRTLLKSGEVQELVELLPPGNTADLHLTESESEFRISDRTGELIASIPRTNSDKLAPAVIHLARYYAGLAIRNEAPDSELAGMVGLSLKKLDQSQTTPTKVDITDAGGELIVEIGDPLVFEITNRSKHLLNYVLLNYSYDWSVSQVLPAKRGAEETIAPGATSEIRITPNAATYPEDIPQATEILKVIATRDHGEYESLLQDESLSDILGTTTRKMVVLAREPRVADQWTTAELKFQVTHKLDDLTQRIQGGEKKSIPGYQFSVEAPPGFSGGVRVLTQRQNTRSTGSFIEPAPPGLASFGEAIQPLSLSSTRTVAPAGTVIEIDADEQARAAVTDESPIRLQLGGASVGDGEGLLALGFDGTLFYPVGSKGSEESTLEIGWLPNPVSDEISEESTTRGIGRTVKLYLFKLAGWRDPDLGLKHARFVADDELSDAPCASDERAHPVAGGEARYRSLQDNELKPGQRVALFVHGFQSDTRWMVGGPLPFLAANEVSYDHILTFDYESLGTHIAHNGETLAEALREAGLGPDDGIHLDVYAHSMGTLVTRSMIELFGGDEFVDRAVLAGPPNHGTELANARLLVDWMGTVLLNSAGIATPTLLASLALKKIVGDSVGPGDLHPDSEFLKTLDQSKSVTVPYLVLAGTNDQITPVTEGAWRRLCQRAKVGADQLLNMIFKDDHDMVIGLESMQTVRNGLYPQDLLTTKVVPCDHFTYYANREAQEALLEWLG